MKYNNIREGIFISRPNRFIAHVEVDGEECICHVKNTGRCKELLIPGTRVCVNESSNPNRKTKFDLISVWKGDVLINMDSQAPNQVVYEWLRDGGLFPDLKELKRETVYGNSRFDLYYETENEKGFIEVKGVTLEEDGVAYFPDAPTLRGIKHLEELCLTVREGYRSYVIFVIQMDGIRHFEPNTRTHPEFGEALKEAERAGVKILAYDCLVEKELLEIRKRISVVVPDRKL